MDECEMNCNDGHFRANVTVTDSVIALKSVVPLG